MTFAARSRPRWRLPDVDHRQAEGRRLDQPARGVADHHVRLAEQRAVRRPRRATAPCASPAGTRPAPRAGASTAPVGGVRARIGDDHVAVHAASAAASSSDVAPRCPPARASPDGASRGASAGAAAARLARTSSARGTAASRASRSRPGAPQQWTRQGSSPIWRIRRAYGSAAGKCRCDELGHRVPDLLVDRPFRDLAAVDVRHRNRRAAARPPRRPASRADRRARRQIRPAARECRGRSPRRRRPRPPPRPPARRIRSIVSTRSVTAHPSASISVDRAPEAPREVRRPPTKSWSASPGCRRIASSTGTRWP